MKFSDQRLRPGERLKSRLAIEAAFRGGKSVKAYPLLLVYTPVDLADARPPARVGFVAPKKAFRRAHDRNFVKRRMREAYRLQKVEFYAWLRDRGTGLDGMLIFTGRDLPDQASLDHAWRKLRRRFADAPRDSVAPAPTASRSSSAPSSEPSPAPPSTPGRNSPPDS